MQSRKSCWKTVFANDLDAFIPEVWAQESLMILENNMVAANLVHRDFEDEIAQYGDVVNTRQPATFTGQRKVDTDNVTVQDATATNVPVKLNQHLHTSFLIRDGEETKGFKNLVVEYLQPALLSIAQMIDEIVMCQVYEFLAYTAGKLGTDLTKATVISAREMMNNNQVPVSGRNMVVCPDSEGALLGIGDFTQASLVGDQGQAVTEGSLGRKFGFDFFMCQNACSVPTGNTIVIVNTVNGNQAVGATSINITSGGTAFVPGQWISIAGDATPQLVLTQTGGAVPTNITVSPGLRYAVSTGAVVTQYTGGAVGAGTYLAGWGKDIVHNITTPKVGQLISFGTTASYNYGALSTPSATAVLLNRPLDATISTGNFMGIGPAGNYNFAFHKNAISLVTRPLAIPMRGTGALSSVANYNNLSLRVTITYNGTAQGHLVTVDLLCGVKTLNTALGCVVFG
jgi:hypothetical protein